MQRPQRAGMRRPMDTNRIATRGLCVNVWLIKLDGRTD